MASFLSARNLIPENGCSLENTSISRPDRFILLSERDAVILDREMARLVCVDLGTGEEKWRVDGSESGEAFIDPVVLSRSDGFYFYLTDYGSRKVWRVDVDGDIRGQLDLSMAVDPLFFELARGGEFLLYDRADGTVHLLDDSAQPLWSFDSGVGGGVGEPLDFACSKAGDTIYLLRKAKSGLSVSVIDIFGKRARDIEVSLESEGEIQSARVEEVTLEDDGNQIALVLLINHEKLFLLDMYGQKIENITPGQNSIQDIFFSDNFLNCLYILTGNPPAVERLRFERDN